MKMRLDYVKQIEKLTIGVPEFKVCNENTKLQQNMF